MPFLYLYNTQGSKMKAEITKKLAISPTPAVLDLVIKQINSLTPQAPIPNIGPNIKPTSKINTAEKSSFRNGAIGKIGNSKKDTP